MNWLSWIFKAVSLVPTVVAGIETIHAGESGATKKQLALASLGLANQVAQGVLPADQGELANSAATKLSSSIDSWVSFFNEAGVFGKSGGSAAPPSVNPAPISIPLITK